MSARQIKRSDEEWEELIRRCKSSGLSDHQWCDENHISISSFYRRLRKLRNRKELGTMPEALAVPAESHEVIPLVARDEIQERNGGPGGSIAAEITAGQIKIRIYNEADGGVIRKAVHRQNDETRSRGGEPRCSRETKGFLIQ